MNTNQQQKIYIDVDEEITTIIDSVYRSNSNEIILVVPRHSLLLQSVVNLKLLTQEAKKYGKKVTLMTRDEEGISFATRAGMNVQLFGADEEDIIKKDNQIVDENRILNKQKNIMNSNYIKNNDNIANDIVSGSVAQQVVTDTNSVDFQQLSGRMDMKPSTNNVTDDGNNSTNIHVTELNKRHTINGVYVQSHNSVPVVNNQVMQNTEKIMETSNEQHYNNMQQSVYSREDNLNNQQIIDNQINGDNFGDYEQTLNAARVPETINTNEVPGEQMKQNNQYKNINNLNQTKKKKQKTRKYKKTKKKLNNKSNEMMMSSSTNTVVKSFMIGGIILILLILLIVILPKTSIIVEPKHIAIDETMEMTAKTDQLVYDAERRLIPARLIEKDVTFTKTFDASGIGDVTAQKAQGTITIYNEYNDKSQPLVATTRFLSKEGVLFRLVNSTIVPGMEDGKAGQVDALVIADEAGVSGNIEPTRFSVPGFDDGPKKDKFYAINEKAMVGGGTGGNNVTIVTEEDIASAQKEMNTELPQYITEQISSLLRPDNEVLIEENIEYEIIRSEANVSPGTMTEQFMYEIVSHVKALVFSEDDVSAVMQENLSDKYHQYNADEVEVEFNYKDVNPDFEGEIIRMKSQGLASIVATVDIEAFEQDILGKKHDEILIIMEEEYDDEIEKIIIDSVVPGFPEFIANHISRFGFMTDIIVK
jgi:hypothetical protein